MHAVDVNILKLVVPDCPPPRHTHLMMLKPAMKPSRRDLRSPSYRARTCTLTSSHAYVVGVCIAVGKQADVVLTSMHAGTPPMQNATTGGTFQGDNMKHVGHKRRAGMQQIVDLPMELVLGHAGR